MRNVLIIFITCLLCVSCKREDPGFRVINGAEAATLDPIHREGSPGTCLLVNLFEGLVRINPQSGGELPGVAKSWDISEDLKTYTFHLREDAKWSDGSKVTAYDFVFSFKRAVDPATNSRNTSLFFLIDNAEKISKGEKPVDDLGVKAIDEKTFQIQLRNPTSFFVSLLALVPFYPVPQHVVETNGDKWVKPEYIVSNGPFMLRSRQLHNKTVMVKNPHYWGKNEVKLDKITFFTSDDDNTHMRMYRSNLADYHVTGISASAYPEIKKNPEWLAAPYLTVYYYLFNTTVPPLDNLKVRQAISLAIDRRIITDKFLQVGHKPAFSLIPPGTNNYESKVKLEENVEKSRKLLAEAGYEGGKGMRKLTILYNTDERHKQVALLIAKMLQDNLGIEVAVENAEWKTQMERRRLKNYDIARGGWIGDYNDPNTFLEVCYSQSTNNHMKWSNKAYDTLFLEAQKTRDPQKRLQLNQAAEGIILQELPVMPIYFYISDTLIKPYVRNLYPSNWEDVANGRFDIMARTVFRNVYIDEEAKKRYLEAKN